MDPVRISDITMKLLAGKGENPLSFKGKLEIAKLLDRLGVSVIELEGLNGSKADALRPGITNCRISSGRTSSSVIVMLTFK